VGVKTQIYPTDLSDSQWNIIEPLIPPAKLGGRPRSLNMRQVINGILYVAVGGVQWRMLPKEYPNWKSVYHYFRLWRQTGVWQRIHDTLRAAVRRQAGRHKQPTAGCLDSQSVKSTAVPGVRGYDKAKNVTGRKRHLLVDTSGLLMAVVVTPASIQERDGAIQLFQRLTGACKKLRCIWVDGGYRGPILADWVAQHCRFDLHCVLRPAHQQGFAVLPRRWVVERTFAWLNHHRRLSKDYEGVTPTSEAFIYIAMIRIMVRRLARA
jgi:putative transposase